MGNGSGREPARVAQGVAFILATAATLALLLSPTVMTATTGSEAGQTLEGRTLLQAQSATVLVPLAIPLILTVIPLLWPARAWRAVSLICIILLAGFVVIGSASVGWFYIPALIAGLIALFHRPKPRQTAGP